ncbi:hypothetical protein FRC00_003425 [Tulasnella sp. 408]|nr:hypothetical protein FRC00_003425 [Tulasnella sp. 408]
MPKVPQLQKESRLNPSTREYLKNLRNIKEEFEVNSLIKPQHKYPRTNQVYVPVVYLKPNGQPYSFRKRIAKATHHSRIDITHCPPATLAYLIDNFPESDISFTNTNLLIPYVPTSEAITRAYQVLPIDTVIEYDRHRSRSVSSSSSMDGEANESSNLTETGPAITVQPPSQQPLQQPQPAYQPAPQQLNNILTGMQGLSLGPQADPALIAAIIAALQTAGVGTHKATKMKIKEPDEYDGKNRGGDAERFLLSCENYFKARSSDFPNSDNKIQFTLSYLRGTAQAWGDVILRDLLGNQTRPESYSWKSFTKAFIKAFGDPDKEGTAIRKLEALT